MPIIKELASREVGDRNDKGSVEERGYIVECSADGDPRDEPGVPRLGQAIAGLGDHNGLLMPCRSVRKGAWITRRTEAGVEYDVWEVYATFTSPDLVYPIGPARPYNEWSMRFARETIQVPFFYAVPRSYVRPGGSTLQTKTEWVAKPYQLELTFTVFEQVIYVNEIDLRDLMKIRAEVGRIHYFGIDYGIIPLDAYAPGTTPPAQGGSRKLPWRFEPPTITMVKTKLWRLHYSWTNDPGNLPIAEQAQEPDSAAIIAPTVARAPFHRYNIKYSITGTYPNQVVTPVIEVVPMYINIPGRPANQQWVNPDGYQSLLGGPIS